MIRLFFIVISLFMQSYETQPYEVVETINDIEIRYYPSVMMVKVESPYANNRNFNALFRYISGENEESEKIAMTTPVHMQNNKTTQEMAFVLPAKYTDTAPQPSGEGVEVFQSKAGYFAAIRYGGYSNQSKQEQYTNLLITQIGFLEKKILGTPVFLSYDSPYKFYNRRNEVLIEIEI
ncbi:MAG: SOUL family heme-binding protein [Flavobacteriaceae bacterium]